MHFDQPRPYSGADSDNLFAALSIDELADVSGSHSVHVGMQTEYAILDRLILCLFVCLTFDCTDYGQVTIMPVRLYLKEATWTLFNKFKSAHDNEEEVARSHFIKAVRSVTRIICYFQWL